MNGNMQQISNFRQYFKKSQEGEGGEGGGGGGKLLKCNKHSINIDVLKNECSIPEKLFKSHNDGAKKEKYLINSQYSIIPIKKTENNRT